jgi:glycerol-3-phosphate O-acyltransferase/dihydroxyacetone phosphate acyltransferase
VTPVIGAMAADEEFSDCERRNSGWIDQDVNAWSSLGYVAMGLVLAQEIWRGRLPRSIGAFAFVLVLEGAGSFLYHSEATDFSQALHDVPLAGMVAFMAGWHVGRIVGAPARTGIAALAIGVAIGSALALFDVQGVNAIVGASLVAIIGAEVFARRRRALAPIWTTPLLVLAGVALLFWVFGTPTSPVCATDSWAQPHGLWHLLTAFLALAWVDLAVAAVEPDRPPQMLRRGTDRAVGLLAVVLVYVFHRSVDVRHRSLLPIDRPVLIVANHGNGFVDPIVVAAALRRLPRFLAKAALWKVVVARPFLAFAGVLPVYRSADGDRSSNNISVFDACERELARGSSVAIFPEGTTGDRGGLDRVRSGAARIALGALPMAPDLVIVPIGLAFESKVETRSRTVVVFGEPIVVADHAVSGGDEVRLDDDAAVGRSRVHDLTAAIGEALEAVSPEFASVDEREMLRAAARIERDGASQRRAARFGAVEEVARRLAALADDERRDVIERYRDYATRLTLVGLDDRQVARARIAWWRLALSAAAIVVAGPLLLTATLIYLPAVAVVVVGTSLVSSTSTKGTVRFLLGLVTGVVTLVVSGVVLGDGIYALVAAAAVAAGGIAALVVWPPILRSVATLHGRLTARDRGSLMAAVQADRQAVIDAVRERVGWS